MLLYEGNLPFASAVILEFMVDHAEGMVSNRALAIKAAEALVADFPETDAALSARRELVGSGSDPQARRRQSRPDQVTIGRPGARRWSRRRLS